MYNKDLLNRLISDVKVERRTLASRRRALKAFEALDYPVWKRIRVKDTSTPDFKPYSNEKIIYHKSEGLSVKPSPRLEGELFEQLSEMIFGPSEKHRRQVEAFANAGSDIVVDSGRIIEEPIILQLTLNEENPFLLDHHSLYVKEGAQVTVVLDYSDEDIKGYHNGIFTVVAEQNAKVHLVKIQNFSPETTHILGGLSVIHRDAQVRFNSIDLGSDLSVTDYSTYIQEDNGESLVDSIYLGEGKTKLDLGYNIYHNGRRTHSDVTVKGALLDEARKVFRGNLFFAKGASRSQGAEEEYVILLDERVKAHSIPALMCDEDDVQGEHAASAGQVDANKLFYLMSRGLTEKEAKELIIMASFAPVIEQLPIEGLKERIHATVDKKLVEDL